MSIIYWMFKYLLNKIFYGPFKCMWKWCWLATFLKNAGVERVNSLSFNSVVWQKKILIKCRLRAVWTYLSNRQLLTLHLIDQHCVCQSGSLWSHIKGRQEEDWKHVGQSKVEREGSKVCRLLAQYKIVHLDSHEPTNHSSKCRGQKGQNVGLNSHYRGQTESKITGLTSTSQATAPCSPSHPVSLYIS